MSKTYLRWTLSALALVALCAPTAADWLVLESGEQIETQGEWTVDGRRIIYTSERGTLSSIRLSGVDVDASRELTKRKLAEATAPPEGVLEPERGEAVLVLTDADFPTEEVAEAPPVEGGAAPEGEVAADGATAGDREVPPSDDLENRPATQTAGSPAIEVVNWSVRPVGDGAVSVLGYIRNILPQAATAITLTVTLLDSDGLSIDETEAELSSSALMPGVQAFYEARFADIVDFSVVEFNATSTQLDLRQDENPEDGPEA